MSGPLTCQVRNEDDGHERQAALHHAPRAAPGLRGHAARVPTCPAGTSYGKPLFQRRIVSILSLLSCSNVPPSPTRPLLSFPLPLSLSLFHDYPSKAAAFILIFMTCALRRVHGNVL